MVDLRDSTTVQFEEVGIQNLNLGTTIPMGLDFFDFEIGDYFFRNKGYGDSEMFTLVFEQIQILSKSAFADSLKYSAKLSSQTTYYYSSGGRDVFPLHHKMVELSYGAEMNTFFNAFPNTIAQLDSNLSTNVYSFRDENQKVNKTNIFEFEAFGNCFHDSFLIQYPIHGPSIKYIEGIGIAMESYNYGLYMENMDLVGYRKVDGTSWGHSNPLSTVEINPEQFIHIYPNPTKNQLTIATEKLNGKIHFELMDLQGRIVNTGDFEQQITTDVSGFSNGIYFVILKNQEGAILHREKVIVQ
jgi:hypothetical protein